MRLMTDLRALFHIKRLGRCMISAGLLCSASVSGLAGTAGSFAAQASVPEAEAVEAEIARLTAPAEAALEAALAREAELKDFPAWEHVRTLDDWLRGIRDLRADGDLSGAYTRALSEYTRWHARRARQVAHAMPFMVLGPILSDRFTDSEYVAPRPRPGSLVEPYLGEFETAPTNATYTLSSGGRTWHRLDRPLDPWQARDELSAAGEDIPLRQAWLIGDRLDFAESADAPADAWGVYYAWTDVYSPERRGMTIDLDTQAPCMYLWRDGLLYLARLCPERASPECGITLRGGGRSFVEGWNRIFIKILMRPGDDFQLRFMHHPHRDGLMEDVRYRLPGRNNDTDPG